MSKQKVLSLLKEAQALVEQVTETNHEPRTNCAEPAANNAFMKVGNACVKEQHISPGDAEPRTGQHTHAWEKLRNHGGAKPLKVCQICGEAECDIEDLGYIRGVIETQEVRIRSLQEGSYRDDKKICEQMTALSEAYARLKRYEEAINELRALILEVERLEREVNRLEKELHSRKVICEAL
jgi:hypothetical protein